MIQMHFTFEGHTIIARRDSVLWHVTIYEHDDGTEKYYQWSDHVMGAVIALACGGDDMESDVVDRLRALVEGIDWGEFNMYRIIP